MKRITYALLFIASIFLSLSVHSQTCIVCTTNSVLSSPGILNSDSIPCIVQGEPYNFSIPLHMLSTYSLDGSSKTIDSIEILEIDNLPCGLCWCTSFPPNNSFLGNQDGCIQIAGTSTDSAGQYQASIILYAFFTTGGTAVGPLQTDSLGLGFTLRVVSPTGNCPQVDTTANAQNLMTNPANCPNAAVNDIPGYISLFDVNPNPLNTDAVVTYTALKTGAYTLNLTDVTGKVLRVQQLQAQAGINKTNLPRQSLPAGLYFLSISNEQGAITRKLVVAE